MVVEGVGLAGRVELLSYNMNGDAALGNRLESSSTGSSFLADSSKSVPQDRLSFILGLYKMFVYVEAVVRESTILSFPPPTCIAHPAAILLHGYWTV